MTITANWWTGEDGPEDANLAAIARGLSLSSRVTGNWGKVSDHWKKADIFHTLFKMGKKEATSLTSVPGKLVV